MVKLVQVSKVEIHFAYLLCEHKCNLLKLLMHCINNLHDLFLNILFTGFLLWNFFFSYGGTSTMEYKPQQDEKYTIGDKQK